MRKNERDYPMATARVLTTSFSAFLPLQNRKSLQSLQSKPERPGNTRVLDGCKHGGEQTVIFRSQPTGWFLAQLGHFADCPG